ncbi:MAG: hypothetical protein R3C58_04770 [Parvularculaceae bacterium]
MLIFQHTRKELAMSDQRLLAACLLSLAAISGASAQERPNRSARPASIDVRSIPVRAANATAAIGEQVLDERGAVNSAYFAENRICTIKGCRVFIFDKRSGALIHHDGVWSSAYSMTDRGLEVIRVKAFSETERAKPAPDDQALETAPRIKKVVRPSAAKIP